MSHQGKGTARERPQHKKIGTHQCRMFPILLLKGLQDRCVRDRASKEVDKWTTMDEVFSLIMFYADQSNNTKIYAKPEYEGDSTIQVREVNQRQGFHQY